jgi:PAS domain-containing protein
VKSYLIFMLDPTGRVAIWNAGDPSESGLHRKEIIGQHFSEITLRRRHRASRKMRWSCACWKRIETGRYKDGSRFFAKHDGDNRRP